MKEFIKRLFCKIGWHSIGFEIVGFDGASQIAKCTWCKGIGLLDSQGNLFAVGSIGEASNDLNQA